MYFGFGYGFRYFGCSLTFMEFDKCAIANFIQVYISKLSNETPIERTFIYLCAMPMLAQSVGTTANCSVVNFVGCQSMHAEKKQRTHTSTSANARNGSQCGWGEKNFNTQINNGTKVQIIAHGCMRACVHRVRWIQKTVTQQCAGQLSNRDTDSEKGPSRKFHCLHSELL